MALTDFKPMRAAGAKLLVLLDPRESETPGGLILPEGSREKAVTGVVRSCGPEFDKAGEVCTGQKVLLTNAYAGSAIGTIGGQELVAVEYDEILAVLE